MKKKSSALILSFVVVCIFSISCISNHEITYLQYGAELKDKQHSTSDSTVRVYEIKKQQYQLKSFDRLDIKIASLTPQEYNPFAIQDPFMVETRSGSGGSGREVTKGYVVKQNGVIELPMIGEMYVEGLTLEALEDSLKIRAKDYLKNPVVKAGLLNFNFSVLSEEVNCLLTTDNSSLTIFQAIALAGVRGEFIDLARVKIIRTTDDGVEIAYLNLLDEQALQSPYYFVSPDDVIVFMPLSQRPVVKYFGRNVSTFASIATALVSVTTLIVMLSK